MLELVECLGAYDNPGDAARHVQANINGKILRPGEMIVVPVTRPDGLAWAVWVVKLVR